MKNRLRKAPAKLNMKPRVGMDYTYITEGRNYVDILSEFLIAIDRIQKVVCRWGSRSYEAFWQLYRGKCAICNRCPCKCSWLSVLSTESRGVVYGNKVDGIPVE